MVDAVVSGDLLAGAVDFARAALTKPLPPPVSQRSPEAPDAAFWVEKEMALAKVSKGATAPLRALACLKKAVEVPFGEAMDFERATFLELRGSEEAAALRAVFFAERAALRPAALKDVPPLPPAQGRRDRRRHDGRRHHRRSA